MKKSAASIIRTKKRARKRWLAGLSRQLTTSNAGVAFLSAQITDLEQRCAALVSRINKISGRQNAREASARHMSFQ